MQCTAVPFHVRDVCILLPLSIPAIHTTIILYDCTSVRVGIEDHHGVKGHELSRDTT